MDIEILRSFFLWMTIINAIITAVSFLIVTFASEWVYSVHYRFFPISKGTFYAAFYAFYGAMKLVVIMFNLVPYIALVIAG